MHATPPTTLPTWPTPFRSRLLLSPMRQRHVRKTRGVRSGCEGCRQSSGRQRATVSAKPCVGRCLSPVNRPGTHFFVLADTCVHQQHAPAPTHRPRGLTCGVDTGGGEETRIRWAGAPGHPYRTYGPQQTRGASVTMSKPSPPPSQTRQGRESRGMRRHGSSDAAFSPSRPSLAHPVKSCTLAHRTLSRGAKRGRTLSSSIRMAIGYRSSPSPSMLAAFWPRLPLCVQGAAPLEMRSEVSGLTAWCRVVRAPEPIDGGVHSLAG